MEDLEAGVTRVEDFLDADGRIIHSNEAVDRGLPMVAQMEWAGVIQSLKKKF